MMSHHVIAIGYGIFAVVMTVLQLRLRKSALANARSGLEICTSALSDLNSATVDNESYTYWKTHWEGRIVSWKRTISRWEYAQYVYYAMAVVMGVMCIFLWRA